MVTIGLPVTITRAGESDRFVEAGLDVVEAHDLDDGATLSCGCGTIDVDDDSPEAEAAYAAMTAVLQEGDPEPAVPRLVPGRQESAARWNLGVPGR